MLASDKNDQLLPASPRVHTLHVEVALNEKATSPSVCVEHDYVRQLVERYLNECHQTVLLSAAIYVGHHAKEHALNSSSREELLQLGIDTIKVCEVGDTDNALEQRVVEVQSCKIFVHVYSLNEELEPMDDVNEEENVLSAHHWTLPSRSLHGLWESLIYDDDIPTRLLSYMYTAMLFSDSDVNPHIISWNRVVLLHGPPGTGKTSLCKALAQKLCIRLNERYPYGRLVEINAHSLFSKWFSESGKLVMKMFQSLRELAADEDMFVCVLMDEIESLTSARKSAAHGNEPSDAVRVVNAVLTQLDQLRRCKNVLILTTSNMTDAIDLAFVDRADIKQLIAVPSERAIYKILAECITELARVGIVDWKAAEPPFLEYNVLSLLSFSSPTPSTGRDSSGNARDAYSQNSVKLQELALLAKGLSGRCLRKLPFLAHAFYIKSGNCGLETFLSALERIIAHEQKTRTHLEGQSGLE